MSLLSSLRRPGFRRGCGENEQSPQRAGRPGGPFAFWLALREWFAVRVLRRPSVGAVAPVVGEPEPVEESDDGVLGEAVLEDVDAQVAPKTEPVSEQADVPVATAEVSDERLGAVLWRVVVGTANDEGRAFFGSLPPAEVARWFGDAEAQLLLEQDGLMAAAVAAVRQADEQVRAASHAAALRAMRAAFDARGRYQTATYERNH